MAIPARFAKNDDFCEQKSSVQKVCTVGPAKHTVLRSWRRERLGKPCGGVPRQTKNTDERGGFRKKGRGPTLALGIHPAGIYVVQLFVKLEILSGDRRSGDSKTHCGRGPDAYKARICAQCLTFDPLPNSLEL